MPERQERNNRRSNRLDERLIDEPSEYQGEAVYTGFSNLPLNVQMRRDERIFERFENDDFEDDEFEDTTSLDQHQKLLDAFDKRVARSKAKDKTTEAKSAFMRLEQERLFGGFSTDQRISQNDTGKTQRKPEGTSKSKETSNTHELQSSKSFSKTTSPAPSNIGELNPVQKLVKAVEYAILELPAEIAEDVRAVLSPGAIASMAGIFAAYAASHAAGIGFIADAAFLLAGVAFLGRQIVGVVKDLIGFSQAVNATTEEELQQAGKHLANAVSTVGISVVMAILTKKTLSKIQRNINNGQARRNPNQLPNGRAGGEITIRGGGEIAPSGRSSSPRLPPVVPAPQLPTTSSTSGANSLPTRVAEQFGELSNLDSATVSTLDGLDDAALAGLGSSLETIAPDIKGQYLNIIALEPSKGQTLIEFRNFETPERFLNVFNAIGSEADVRLIESIFGDAYLKSTEVEDPSKPYLSNGMQERYKLMLEEVASGSLNSSNPEYSTSFIERLKILEEIKEVRTELYERLGAKPYKSGKKNGFRIVSRNVAHGKYNIVNTSNPNSSVTGDFLSLSGYYTDDATGNNKLTQRLGSDELDGKEIVSDVVNGSREIFEPKSDQVEGDPAQDSERKVLESIARQMETEWNEQFDIEGAYPDYAGDVKINSEMLPCDSCKNVITEQFKKMFPNINLEVKHGVPLEKPKENQ